MNATIRSREEIVQQLYQILKGASWYFSDELEAYLRSAKNVELDFLEKEHIEGMFKDIFKSYLMAEVPALVGAAICSDSENRDVLNRISDFLDLCEMNIDKLPQALIEKTEQLPDLAQTGVQSGVEGGIVESIYRDLARIKDGSHLRRTFNALLLKLYGQ